MFCNLIQNESEQLINVTFPLTSYLLDAQKKNFPLFLNVHRKPLPLQYLF